MKAIKVRIYPTKEQACFLNGQFGAVPMVYNKALAIISNRYKKYKQSVSFFTLKKLLPIAKRSRKYYWLKEYDSIALQQAVLNLDKGLKRLFKKQQGKQSSYHLSDASWGMFFEKIAYKAEQAGKHFKKISQWYASSKTCNICKSLVEKLTLDIRKWQCTNCNAKHDRDINTAINIKLEGLKLLIADSIAVLLLVEA